MFCCIVTPRKRGAFMLIKNNVTIDVEWRFGDDDSPPGLYIHLILGSKAQGVWSFVAGLRSSGQIC